MADDKHLEIQTIKMSLETINELQNSEFFINGQEVIDRVRDIVAQIQSERKTLTEPIQPLEVLLLDFQMPYKNGIEVV